MGREYRAGTLINEGHVVGYFILGSSSSYTFVSKREWDGVIHMLVTHGSRVELGHEVDVGGAPAVRVE